MIFSFPKISDENIRIKNYEEAISTYKECIDIHLETIDFLNKEVAALNNLIKAQDRQIAALEDLKKTHLEIIKLLKSENNR